MIPVGPHRARPGSPNWFTKHKGGAWHTDCAACGRLILLVTTREGQTWRHSSAEDRSAP